MIKERLSVFVCCCRRNFYAVSNFFRIADSGIVKLVSFQVISFKIQTGDTIKHRQYGITFIKLLYFAASRNTDSSPVKTVKTFGNIGGRAEAVFGKTVIGISTYLQYLTVIFIFPLSVVQSCFKV